MVKSECFNEAAELPHALRLTDFGSAMTDVYDLMYDINSALLLRGLQRFDDMLRPAAMSGLFSDALTASVATHSRGLVPNRHFNGHPDLVPRGRYSHDTIAAGEGVEIKATRGGGAVDMNSVRTGWLCVFRYQVDDTTEPAVQRAPTRFTEILLADLVTTDFRRNERGDRGTRTTSPNRTGISKLRANWVYRDL